MHVTRCVTYQNLLLLEKCSFTIKRNNQLLLDKQTLDGATGGIFEQQDFCPKNSRQDSKSIETQLSYGEVIKKFSIRRLQRDLFLLPSSQGSYTT